LNVGEASSAVPKKAKELSAAEVRRLTKPGLHAVGGVSGLLLQVSPTGSQSWTLRTMVGTKRRDIGLGGFPDVQLAQARERAREAKDSIRQGIDPIEQRKAVRSALLASQIRGIVFDECARQFINSKSAEFTNIKQAAQWRSSLRDYASPVIGNLPVGSIELVHVLKILEPIWQTKTETATRVRARIESVLDWATVSKYRQGDNPARWKGNLDKILPNAGKLKNRKHFKALPWTMMGGFMEQLRQRPGISAKALEFLILTATRSSETRGAQWEEIDLDAKLWTIPAERMKANKEHVVPLCNDAIKLLKGLDSTGLVFPGAKGTLLSDVALSKPLKTMNVDATVHGFRSTFRDWCSESTNYPNEVAEMALAHTISNAVERAYRRGDLLAKRTKLMADWCKHVNTKPKLADVIPIRGKTKTVR
jgi:integrase